MRLPPIISIQNYLLVPKMMKISSCTGPKLEIMPIPHNFACALVSAFEYVLHTALTFPFSHPSPGSKRKSRKTPQKLSFPPNATLKGLLMHKTINGTSQAIALTFC
jgi:hypothetical protein